MYTISAPTVIPNIASDSATNAKWYSIVTLKIRVSRISYIRVESATQEEADVSLCGRLWSDDHVIRTSYPPLQCFYRQLL